MTERAAVIQDTLDNANEAAQRLQSLMDAGITTARTIIEGGEENLPTWIIQDAEGHMDILVTPWHDEQEKDMIGFVIREQLKSLNAVRLVFICETWMVEAQGTEELNCQPRNHPKRKEMLMVNGEDKTGEMIFKHFEILRPQNKLGPEMERGYASASGRFVNMFK